jgi:hypothetical protein
MAIILCLPFARKRECRRQSKPVVSSRQTYSTVRGNSRPLIGGDGKALSARHFAST